MSLQIAYKIPFVTLRKAEPLEVLVYQDRTGTVTPQSLYGGESPFITEEDNDNDLFMPVRSQSGYLNIVDTRQDRAGVAFSWQDMLPAQFMDGPVVLRNSSTGTVYWKGFLQNQQPQSDIYVSPAERSFAVYDILGVMEHIDFNVGIASHTTNSYVNFAYLLNRIILTLPEVVRPAYLYFQDFANPTPQLLCKVNPMLFCQVTDAPDAGSQPSLGSQTNISALHAEYSCREVLEEICKFWGFSCRSYGGNLYFSRGSSAGYYQYSMTQIGYMAGGTVQSPSSVSLSNYTMAGSDLVSTENNVTDLKPIDNVSIKTSAGAYKEIIKLFPDNPRMALATNVLWNTNPDGSMPELRISVANSDYYYADSHFYLFNGTLTAPGNIFGLRTDAEKWGIGERYSYEYVAGALMKLGDTLNLVSRWPFCFTDCRLSLKGTIFDPHGKKITETMDDTDEWGQVGKVFIQMQMILHHANGTDYYWNGDRWQSSSAYFQARIGGGDGYIYPLSATIDVNGESTILQNHKMPRKYITFETLINAYDVPPVGRLEIAFLNPGRAEDTGLADVTVEVERTPLPSVYDSVSEEHTYYPDGGVRRKAKEVNEWTEDTIFASDDRNQFGIGTVLNSGNELLAKMQVNGQYKRPEEMVANMVYQFCKEARQVLCTELNRGVSGVELISPTRYLQYLTAQWLPFSIRHYWRDDIKKVYAINISGGTVLVTLRIVAGTGIASVSPSGSITVVSGGSQAVTCADALDYVFSHWLKGSTVISTERSFTLRNITESTTLTAVAVPITTQYTVVVISNAAGITSVSGAGTYTHGQTVTVSCAIASGYDFQGWCLNNAMGTVMSQQQTYSFTIRGNVTLYPLAESQDTDEGILYFAIEQPAWGSIKDDSDEVFGNGDWYEFTEGELRRYTAVPATGYEFVKWRLGTDDYSTAQTIQADFDLGIFNQETLTAVFQEATTQYNTLRLRVSPGFIRSHATLYVKIGDDAEVSYPYSLFASDEDMKYVSVPDGSQVRLRVVWDDNYYPARFDGWYSDETGLTDSTSTSYTFTMRANKYYACYLTSQLS